MPSEKTGFDFWLEDLKGARYVVAPMVDQSELAWRLLSRQHGAQLCYTPMLHASIFVRDARYRRENLTSSPNDRPLIVQFCANDPDTFLEAARMVMGQCEAVDLNLGCPQAIAKKGHYGAYLQDEWDLIYKMVNAVHINLSLPITCKIRVFENIDKTVSFAKMLEAAGCQLLAVHGRTREQKGPHTGIASWDHIRAIKQNVKIPVFANGNIQYAGDLTRCLQETGADGVMIAEGSLYNPALFDGLNLPVWHLAMEYLDLVVDFPCPTSYIRGHLFKLFHHCLSMEENKDLQDELAKCGKLQGFRDVTCKLRDRFLNCSRSDNDLKVLKDKDLPHQLPLPAYICQPYVRPGPIMCSTYSNERENMVTGMKRDVKRALEDQLNSELSRRKMKKMLRNPKKKFGRKEKEQYALCNKCHNPKSPKCSHSLCRACCRTISSLEKVNCDGHKFVYRKLSPVVSNA